MGVSSLNYKGRCLQRPFSLPAAQAAREIILEALLNAEIETPGGALKGAALLIDQSRIAAIVPASEVPAVATRIDLGGGVLAAGFIDIQVNGGGGILFNDATSADGVARIAAAHRKYGTTGFLPTLISDSRAVRQAAFAAVAAARAAGAPGVLGIHIEGPHLLPARRGVHAEHLLAPAEAADFALLTAQPAGTVLVTLAPECADEDFIRRLAMAGVKISLGHTAASLEQASRAFAAGSSGVTHLFNGMPAVSGREPGVVAAALLHPKVWCGIIADGHHVHWANVELAWRMKGRQLMLVTDAMPPVGTADRSFRLYDEVISATDGRCATRAGTLAGSLLDMATAVRNCVREIGMPRADALAIAAASPADFLGMAGERGRIVPGLAADLVHLDDEFRVCSTWIAGAREVHR